MRFFRRRRFIIDRALQSRLVIMHCTYGLFLTVATALSLFIPLVIQLRGVDVVSAPVVAAADLFLYIHTHFWPVVIMALLTICLHSVFISHKICGPLYRFKRVFNAINQGHLSSPVRLRHGDYLRSEMQAINAMLVTLRSQAVASQQAHATLMQQLMALQKTPGCTADEGLRQRLTQLTRSAEHLETILGFFTEAI
jgi:methyl-accepting chemotaxis protein